MLCSVLYLSAYKKTRTNEIIRLKGALMLAKSQLKIMFRENARLCLAIELAIA